MPGTVFTLGDNAYRTAPRRNSRTATTRRWGRHKARTRPVTGNHDYDTPNATGYYDYFNGVSIQTGPAGNRTTGGYYSYNLGNWHVVVLNSECTIPTRGCRTGVPQVPHRSSGCAPTWPPVPTNNIIAMWHRPLYSSSSCRDDARVPAAALAGAVRLRSRYLARRTLAQLRAPGATERLRCSSMRRSASGRSWWEQAESLSADSAYPNLLPDERSPEQSDHGVMKFTFTTTSYDWEFIPIAGQTIHRFGHGPGARPRESATGRGCGNGSNGRVRRGVIERQRH